MLEGGQARLHHTHVVQADLRAWDEADARLVLARENRMWSREGREGFKTEDGAIHDGVDKYGQTYCLLYIDSVQQAPINRLRAGVELERDHDAHAWRDRAWRQFWN